MWCVCARLCAVEKQNNCKGLANMVANQQQIPSSEALTGEVEAIELRGLLGGCSLELLRFADRFCLLGFALG